MFSSYFGRFCRLGREDRIRTCDPLVPNQVRYRPALLPAFAESSAGKPAEDLEKRFYIFAKPLRSSTAEASAKAVREGFEPSVQFNPYGSLANYWF